MTENRLTRIGIFYDGNYFLHVSNYYAYNHERQARIDVSGLHHYIRQKVAECEGADHKRCQIIDAHYFRGRLRAQDADERDLLFKERVFDDILTREGITNHYLPLGPFGEKGIDVWLALEAYELAIYKRFDVIVLIASDGDFLPLVRKLNTIGTRIMLLAWNYEYMDKNGILRETKTSQSLLEEATYPVLMHQTIDDPTLREDPVINGLFVPRRIDRAPRFSAATAPSSDSAASTAGEPGPCRGHIKAIKEGYGFIAPIEGGENLFFFHAEVLNAEFNDLEIGDAVNYHASRNDKGPCALQIRVEKVGEPASPA